jgi:lycopene cyclase domain-containing protein
MIDWLDNRYYYLLLMLLSISYPLIRSFENKIRFYKNWKSLVFAISIMMTIFITWDVIFTNLSVWSFNDRYILGYKFLSLPIEEWMFFICIPYSCVFIHEVLSYFFPIKKIRFNIYRFNQGLAVLLFIIGLTSWGKIYTSFCFVLTGLFLLLLKRKKIHLIALIYRTFTVSLIPFFIVNGILTGALTDEPIVIYNNLQTSMIRIVTIPIEDFVYCLFMLGLTIWIYESQKKNSISKT